MCIVNQGVLGRKVEYVHKCQASVQRYSDTHHCRTLLRKLTQLEENKKQEEGYKNELQKNFEKTAREGLRQIPIPDLKTIGPGSNVVLWIETIRRKYNKVKKTCSWGYA